MSPAPAQADPKQPAHPHMVIHVDMDAFYAAVEMHDRPKLVGQPVVVGGARGNRGVVAAASYEARNFGIHSAMPAAQARRLCPQAVFLPVRMARYVEISQAIRAIFHAYTPLVEPLSLDEAFLDVNASCKLLGSVGHIAAEIKRDIVRQTGLIASVGIGPNKFIAKIASDLDKPDGFLRVGMDEVEAFLAPLPVTRLWGVGARTEARLRAMGIRRVGDVRALPRSWLEQHFGRWGERLWSLSRGLDDRPVVAERQSKSLSHETTFDADISERDTLVSWSRMLLEEVAYRLRHQELWSSGVALKLRFGDFRTIVRSRALAEPTQSTETLWRVLGRLWREAVPSPLPPVRLLGVGVQRLTDDRQLQGALFGEQQHRDARLDAALDVARERFGAGVLRRGARQLK